MARGGGLGGEEWEGWEVCVAVEEGRGVMLAVVSPCKNFDASCPLREIKARFVRWAWPEGGGGGGTDDADLADVGWADGAVVER